MARLKQQTGLGGGPDSGGGDHEDRPADSGNKSMSDRTPQFERKNSHSSAGEREQHQQPSGTDTPQVFVCECTLTPLG